MKSDAKLSFHLIPWTLWYLSSSVFLKVIFFKVNFLESFFFKVNLFKSVFFESAFSKVYFRECVFLHWTYLLESSNDQ